MEPMMPFPIYSFFLVFLALLLFFFAFGLFTSRSKKRRPDRDRKGIVGEKGVCPLCTTILARGEQLKSAVYPGDDDRICHIFGCPHCHPYMEDSLVRRCPVCKKKVPQEGYLIARMFDRPGGRKHVHILGCTECRMPGSRKQE